MSHTAKLFTNGRSQTVRPLAAYLSRGGVMGGYLSWLKSGIHLSRSGPLDNPGQALVHKAPPRS